MALSLKRSKKAASNNYARDARPKPLQAIKPLGQLRQRRDTTEGSGGGIFGLVRWILGIVGAGALLCSIALGLLYAYRYATTSEYFAIRTITVRGNAHFDRTSVLKTAGLLEGMNSLAVNIADVERALRKTPWVSNVSVKRRLPDSFEIDIVERLPAFWVVKDEGLLYADSKGNLIAPVEPENFLSLPSLELEQGGEELLVRLDDFVKALKSTALPLEIGTASWLRLSAARGFELYLEKHGLTVSIGTDDWEVNLRRLGIVLNDLARRGEIRFARDVWAADGNVWVRRDEGK